MDCLEQQGKYETEKAGMRGADEGEEQVYTRVRLGHLREKTREGMRELIETSEDNNNEHRERRSWGIYDESEGRNNRR
jgi:hypothetical protein